MELLSVAGGELHGHREGAAPIAIESRFARDLLERDAASRRNTSWKHAEREEGGRGMPVEAVPVASRRLRTGSQAVRASHARSSAASMSRAKRSGSNRPDAERCVCSRSRSAARRSGCCARAMAVAS